MNESMILQRITQIESINDVRLMKYRRNLNRFCNNGVRSQDVWNLYGQPMGYWFMANSEEDTGAIPVLNVIKSSVNTFTSKISQTKVRPFFNPTNGSFDTRFVSRQAQLFFDDFFERQRVHKTATLCARDAAIFDYGVVWVDDEDIGIKHIAPWEMYVDPAEYNFGKLSDCHVRFRQYPLSRLKKFLPGTRFAEALTNNPFAKVEYRVYYDLFDRKKYHLIDGEIVKKVSIEYDIAPFATLYYEDPLKGIFSTSMADNQYTIQQQIDSISEKVAIAIALNPANTILLPKGSDVKASMVSNQIGAVYEYMPIPGIASPVQISTPSPISPMYLELLQFYQRQAYEMEGISQLSAQQKKPSGVNSGVAIDTLQDVESERHNAFLQSYIRFYMAIAEVCIQVFPGKMNILPEKVGRAAIQWEEIKLQQNAYNVQFSASSSLSKDPKIKLEQLEKMVSMGLINQKSAAIYMEMPDLEAAYGVLTASYDYNLGIIGKALKDGQVEVSPLTDLQGLYVEIVNEILRLTTANDEPVYIERAKALLAQVEGLLDGVAQQQNPQQPAPQPQPSDTAMDAGQVGALTELAKSVTRGELTQMQAVSIARATYPGINPQVVVSIFGLQPGMAQGGVNGTP